MVNEASILSKLNLGASKAILENKTGNLLVDFMNALAQDITDQLTASIDKYGISASNNLKQSITPIEATIKGSAVEVAVQADFYWKFVQYGVNGYLINRGAPAWGKQPSSGKEWHESTIEWIQHRGIKPKEKDVTIEQLAWIMMRGKVRDGQSPRPFFTDVVNEKAIALLRAPIERFLKRTIEIRILEPWQ